MKALYKLLLLLLISGFLFAANDSRRDPRDIFCTGITSSVQSLLDSSDDSSFKKAFPGDYNTEFGYFVDAPYMDLVLIQEAYRAFNVQKVQGTVSLLEARDFSYGNKVFSFTEKKLNELALVTSGAGIASRMGGGGGAYEVKATVPYNLSELVSDKDQEKLSRISSIFTAKDIFRVLSMAKLMGLVPRNFEVNSVEDVYEIYRRAQRESHAVINRARNTKIRLGGKSYYAAINPIDVKLIDAAILTKIAGGVQYGAYVPLDIWTSRQTHSEIFNYLKWLEASYGYKRFSLDPVTNARIQHLLSEYIMASQKRGETHVFGYQEEVPALDKDSNYIEGSNKVGAGTGKLIDYYNASGRMAQLLKDGRKYLSFQNIEIDAGIMTNFSSFLGSGSEVGVVLVPSSPNFSGGRPYKYMKNGVEVKAIFEDSEVPESLVESAKASDGYPFSTGSLFIDIRRVKASPVGNYVFENKKGGVEKRVRTGISDLTKQHDTVMIKGNPDEDYAHLKDLDNYETNGSTYLRAIEARWVRLLKMIYGN